MKTHEFEQAIRKSHCARTDAPGSSCVGVVTIGRDGVRLSCKLCGDGDERMTRNPEVENLGTLAGNVLRALGMSAENLTSECLLRLYDALRQDKCHVCKANDALRQERCYVCKASKPHDITTYWDCLCGKTSWSRSGWRTKVKP